MIERAAPLNSATQIREVLHELRAPLGGIRAMSELLAQSALTPEQRDIVAALEASAAHLRAIADSILGAGEDESASAPRPLGTFLSALAVGVRLRAEALGLHFNLEIEGEGLENCPVGTPPLRQVLENLLDNALRLSKGDVTLVIGKGVEGRVQFAVFDKGPGVSAQDAERLIRDGGRMDGRAGGAGLGLSISGRLVADHGGRLEGGPGEDGQGSCFTFDWPDGSAKGMAAGLTCLIVDDHPASRMVLRTILSAAGYAVVEAADPREALVAFERHRPQVVISDLNMPEGGGSALMLRLATLRPGVRPLIVVISADDVSQEDPLHPVIDASLRKPITVAGVLGVMAQARGQLKAAA